MRKRRDASFLGALGFVFLGLSVATLGVVGAQRSGPPELPAGPRIPGDGQGLPVPPPGGGPGAPPPAGPGPGPGGEDGGGFPGFPGPPGGLVPPCGRETLCPEEVDAVVRGAVTAVSTPTMVVAVVDRPGNILALFRKPGGDPADDITAAGVARTATFFSNNRAPLSSRTVRFLSGLNFPPGVRNTPNGGLYGIENNIRGCFLNAVFNPGKEVPPARSPTGIANGEPCNPFNTLGCGPGIVTGKADPFDTGGVINPGGVPLFRKTPEGDVFMLGAVGVAGVPPDQAEFAAFLGSVVGTDTEELLPLPEPGAVIVDGIRLPFVQQIDQPPGTAPGPFVGAYDSSFLPRAGQPAPEGYLVGPLPGLELSAAEVDLIVRQSIAGADRTRAQVRLPIGLRTKMVITVSDLDGKVLALFRMQDALFDAVDVTVAKARNVVFYSKPAGAADLPGVPPGTAMTTRAIGFGAQPFYPPGINGSGPGPFFDLFVFDFFNDCSQGSEPTNPNQNNIVFFPGGIPLYRGNRLVGGLGVSGDGLDQDDYVAFLGAQGFLPPKPIRSDRVVIRGVRLPFLKFPRNPEA